METPIPPEAGPAKPVPPRLFVDMADLSIEKLPKVECSADGCDEVATHYIQIDVRGAGFSTQLAGPFCLHCAHLEHDRLMLCFPPPPPAPKDDVPF